jgi:glycerophosphoryl diester phosphodiesterase
MIVVAHRGSSGTAPENTMAAFLAAAAAGADLIELDVRFSAECTCVVMHDRSLRRTTNGRGYVHATALSALQRLDAGRWFSPRFAMERIPTLAEVLDALPPAVGMNCEVKTDGDPRSRLERARVLAETLQRHGRGRLLIVSSFDHRFLSILSHHAPALALGVLLQPVRDITRRASRLAHRVGATSIFCSRRMLRRRLVDDARRHNLNIGVYAVDTPAQLLRMQRYGVDMVFTNHPEILLPCLANV